MKSSNKRGLVITITTLSLVIVGLTIALVISIGMTNSHAAMLEGVYQRSFYDLVDNVNSVESDISKLLITADAAAQQKTLLNIKQQTANAQNNISALPVNQEVITVASNFMNKLNGYVTTLINNEGNKISAEKVTDLNKIYDGVVKLKEELNDVSYKLTQGYSIMKNIDSRVDKNNFSLNFSGLSNESIEYPSLIYDGPFSDSIMNREIRGLDKTECNEAEAREFVYHIFDGATDLAYLGRTQGKFVTYDYKVMLGAHEYNVQITKMGKFLLNISSDSYNGKAIVSEEDARKNAVTFGTKATDKNLKVVWSAASKGIAYINLAPIIDDVIIYPDLIVVKVDLSNGKVIGYEAAAYAYNHVGREITEAKITHEEAKAEVDSKLEIKQTRLCIIPLEYGGEALAYEIEGEFNGSVYYIYIDANTKAQIKIMKVITTSNGSLVL